MSIFRLVVGQKSDPTYTYQVEILVSKKFIHSRMINEFYSQIHTPSWHGKGGELNKLPLEKAQELIDERTESKKHEVIDIIKM